MIEVLVESFLDDPDVPLNRIAEDVLGLNDAHVIDSSFIEQEERVQGSFWRLIAGRTIEDRKYYLSAFGRRNWLIEAYEPVVLAETSTQKQLKAIPFIERDRTRNNVAQALGIYVTSLSVRKSLVHRVSTRSDLGTFSRSIVAVKRPNYQELSAGEDGTQHTLVGHQQKFGAFLTELLDYKPTA